jgi:hypothetical protein
MLSLGKNVIESKFTAVDTLAFATTTGTASDSIVNLLQTIENFLTPAKKGK